jgi:hypothetical protein
MDYDSNISLAQVSAYQRSTRRKTACRLPAEHAFGLADIAD